MNPESIADTQDKSQSFPLAAELLLASWDSSVLCAKQWWMKHSGRTWVQCYTMHSWVRASKAAGAICCYILSFWCSFFFSFFFFSAAGAELCFYQTNIAISLICPPKITLSCHILCSRSFPRKYHWKYHSFRARALCVNNLRPMLPKFDLSQKLAWCLQNAFCQPS